MKMDKASGFITTDWMTADKTYCDCRTPAYSTANREIRGKFKVTVRKASESVCE